MCRSTAASKCRNPTPVRKIITSIPPVISRWAKSIASRFCSIGTSRMLGLTNGVSPKSLDQAGHIFRPPALERGDSKPLKIGLSLLTGLFLRHATMLPTQAAGRPVVAPRAKRWFPAPRSVIFASCPGSATLPRGAVTPLVSGRGMMMRLRGTAAAALLLLVAMRPLVD
jgi:hypothetical protein